MVSQQSHREFELALGDDGALVAPKTKRYNRYHNGRLETAFYDFSTGERRLVWAIEGDVLLSSDFVPTRIIRQSLEEDRDPSTGKIINPATVMLIEEPLGRPDLVDPTGKGATTLGAFDLELERVPNLNGDGFTVERVPVMRDYEAPPPRPDRGRTPPDDTGPIMAVPSRPWSHYALAVLAAMLLAGVVVVILVPLTAGP